MRYDLWARSKRSLQPAHKDIIKNIISVCFKKKQGRKGRKIPAERFVSYDTNCFGIVTSYSTFLIRKEVIQPHLPVRLPCYDFTPLTRHTFGTVLLTVRLATSGTPNSGGVTGGVYKARERIHRAMLMRDY